MKMTCISAALPLPVAQVAEASSNKVRRTWNLIINSYCPRSYDHDDDAWWWRKLYSNIYVFIQWRGNLCVAKGGCACDAFFFFFLFSIEFNRDDDDGDFNQLFRVRNGHDFGIEIIIVVKKSIKRGIDGRKNNQCLELSAKPISRMSTLSWSIKLLRRQICFGHTQF